MLIRLRRRFILITMGLIGAVLLVVLAASVVSGYQGSIGRIDTALRNALERDIGNGFMPWIGSEGRPPQSAPTLPDNTPSNQGLPGDRTPPSGGQFVPVYVATISATDSEIISDNRDVVGIDAALLTKALGNVTAELSGAGAGITTGQMFDLRLMYHAKVDADGNIRVALADTSSAITEMLQQLGISALIWLCAMLLFFLISLLLSNIALRPVAEAWEKQRQFVSDASHELKTPLTVILANNSLLQAHPDKTIKEQMRWLQNTQLEAERMDDLVRNLLLLAQTDEEGQTAMANTFGVVDLSALVQQNLLQFETVLFERGIELSSDIAGGLQVQGNKDQLGRLVSILLDNASKYASAPSAAVRVSLQPFTESKGGRSSKHIAILKVTNNGEPIDPTTLPHLFDRFYRGDAAHSSAEGSGLGLSLAKAIVDVHHGEISVQSTAELGTVFTVVL